MRRCEEGASESLLPLYHKLFVFGADCGLEETLEAVALSRGASFGLTAYTAKLAGDSPAPSKDKKRSRSEAPAVDAELRRCFSADGCLDFSQVFGAGAEVKLEVGAGAGEWACAQARQDPRGCWATLELRCDRVYETFTKAAYHGLRNLCVLGGNALDVLPARIPAASVAHLFVNYPEPPQQSGSDCTSQSKHLLCHVSASRLISSAHCR